MKYSWVILAVLMGSVPSGGAVGAENPLLLVQTIPLTGVSGRIDHMSIDLPGKRLFVAALGNNSVEVIDLIDGKRIATIAKLSEPQGVLYLPEFSRVVVANAHDGTVRFYEGKVLRELKTVHLGEDADNVRYDSTAREIYVGYGRGALAVLNPATGEKVADIKLSGHPESFQLETQGPRVFVNIPTARQVAVIDRVKRTVIDTWRLEDFRSNFPMALDETNHRLFVGCRGPAKLAVLDTQSGQVKAAFDCVGDADDVFYDCATRCIYISGGDGKIDVFAQTDADHYQLISETPTALGARTSLLAQDLRMLYVCVPGLLVRQAEIRAYGVR